MTTPSRTRSSWSTRASPSSRGGRRSGRGFFGIARRVARNHRPKAAFAREGERTLEALPDLASPSPLATLEAVEAARLLERLLADLGAPKREAFILVELEEMTVLEASQALDTNTNTLAARVRAARQELKEAIARLEAHRDWKRRCAT